MKLKKSSAQFIDSNLLDPRTVMVNRYPYKENLHYFIGNGDTKYMESKGVTDPISVENKFKLVSCSNAYHRGDYIVTDSVLSSVCGNYHIEVPLYVDEILSNSIERVLGNSVTMTYYSILFYGKYMKVIPFDELVSEISKYDRMVEYLQVVKEIEQDLPYLQGADLDKDKVYVILHEYCDYSPHIYNELHNGTEKVTVYGLYRYLGYEKFPRINPYGTKIVGKNTKSYGFELNSYLMVSTQFLTDIVHNLGISNVKTNLSTILTGILRGDYNELATNDNSQQNINHFKILEKDSEEFLSLKDSLSFQNILEAHTMDYVKYRNHFNNNKIMEISKENELFMLDIPSSILTHDFSDVDYNLFSDIVSRKDLRGFGRFCYNQFGQNKGLFKDYLDNYMFSNRHQIELLEEMIKDGYFEYSKNIREL